jgi:signal transduction histidine kinase
MYEIFRDFTILCVDDDKVVLEILKNSFKKLFKEIYTAQDGLEGYEAFKKYNPDIIITDITMPILDGMDMIGKIRELDNDVPIYVSSAIEDSRTLLRSIEYGVNGYVVKPIDIKMLIGKLEKSAKIISYEALNKKHQDELKKLNNSLEEKVAQQTKELEEFNQNLQTKINEEIERNFIASKELLSHKKNSHIAELITNLSHQWRQPLSIISALAGGIKVNRSLGIDDPDQEQKDLNQIIKTTKELSATIEKLRVFTKNNKLDKNSFELNQTIEDVLKIVEDGFIEDGITIKRDLKDYIKINSHLKEFSTIILELFLNAKEAINKSAKSTKTIQISTYKDENEDIHIKIKDSGDGFDEESIHKVFDPYYSTKFSSSGVGLSLYFVKDNIRRLFDGAINVSNCDDGAVVSIVIPANNNCE